MSKAKRPLPPEERADNDRLKAIWNSKKAELRLNQELLADAMDIGQSAVSHYLNGYNRLNARAAARFAEVLKVKVSDFSPSLALEIERMAQTGLSVVDDEDRRPTPPPENHTQLGVTVAPDWTTAQVPIMDQAFSAGQGAAAEKLEDFVDGFKDISHSDLTALNIQPSNARIIKIRGDSMWSTLWDGDEVLADTYVPRLISGKIYAFEFDGELKVKRFTKKMDGSWLISSDNKDDPAYTDEVVSAHNAQQLRVIAEVKKLVSRNL
ncbi:LexA family transcriptional regulator [Marinobacterium iners]|uniref:LexA family transcriptional regulator n=1 Tax=Marinobacterium iners TaxID=48076 RepID=UPI001A8D33EE|nr:LexA family transcriptional regulator [Marinobacterium iners]